MLDELEIEFGAWCLSSAKRFVFMVTCKERRKNVLDDGIALGLYMTPDVFVDVAVVAFDVYCYFTAVVSMWMVNWCALHTPTPTSSPS